MSASPDISLSSSDESEGDEDGDILSSSGEITTDSETVDDPSNERPSALHSTSQSTQKAQSRPTWDGNILFPPPEMSTKNPSPAWKFGGIEKDENGKLILENVICGECRLKLKYKTSPSSFLQHLSNKHLVLNQTKEPGAKIKDFFNLL